MSDSRDYHEGIKRMTGLIALLEFALTKGRSRDLDAALYRFMADSMRDQPGDKDEGYLQAYNELTGDPEPLLAYLTQNRALHREVDTLKAAAKQNPARYKTKAKAKETYRKSLNKAPSIWDPISLERRGQAAEFQEEGNKKVKDWNEYYAWQYR